MVMISPVSHLKLIDVTSKARQLINETSAAFSKSEDLLTEGMSAAEKAMFVSLRENTRETGA
ncbi:MAG: hypothetical protein P4L49_17815 [Desulfosporosinus sp.]|nr:hypothetical protein [Desulfosporosinus sp.]